MTNRWLAMEQYRFQLIESWPDSPYKQAALESVKAAIAMLRSEAATVDIYLRKAA